MLSTGIRGKENHPNGQRPCWLVGKESKEPNAADYAKCRGTGHRHGVCGQRQENDLKDAEEGAVGQRER